MIISISSTPRYQRDTAKHLCHAFCVWLPDIDSLYESDAIMPSGGVNGLLLLHAEVTPQ